MLNWFRDKAKIFLIAIIVTFVILIFVDWGTGRMNRGRGYGNLAVASVDGRELSPEQYDAKFMEVYSRAETMMARQGDPSPSSELQVMTSALEEAAFSELIDSELQSRYLRRLGWPIPGRQHAAALIRAQIALSGVEDPDGYYRQYSETPGFVQMLDQYVAQIYAALFPATSRLQNMASNAELEYSIAMNYSPVTARYIVFRADMAAPSDAELQAFYDGNPGLFTDKPHSTIQYVIAGVQPDAQDLERTRLFVDSLAVSSATADTLVMTRENLLAFGGADSLPVAGTPSGAFVGPSLRGSAGQCVHEFTVLSISPSADDRTGASDTISVAHWEQTVLPGIDAIRNALYDAEDQRVQLLSTSVPESDSLMILDWGQAYVEQGQPVPADFPQSVVSFALDSTYADSIGPAFYIPSFRGGYPAFLLAKRTESSFDTTTVSFDEAYASGRLLLTAYTRMQADSSYALASRAMQEMRSNGLSMGMYAMAESLQIGTTPAFYVTAVRQAALGDPDAYSGILANAEFATAALVAPLLTPIGPFRIGGSAAIAEIESRTEMPMPGDPAVLAPLYLSVQANHSTSAFQALMRFLRSGCEIVDLRDRYEAAADSIRDSQNDDSRAPLDY